MRTLAFTLITALLFAPSLVAIPGDESASQEEVEEPEAPSEEEREVSGVWDLPWSDVLKVRLNPSGDLFERYVADPRRPRHVLSVMSALDSEVPFTGSPRFNLSIGGQYPLARFFTEREDRGWQLNVAARFYAQFDIDHNLDEIGHDGRVGMILSHRITDAFAIRFLTDHTSNHIGDEYILRNELKERPSVRREELAVGLSWDFHRRWRTYAETGYGLNLGDANEPGRLQWGLEYTSPRLYEEVGLYAGVDVTTWQENDWEPSIALQTGLVFASPMRGRSYRLGIELYDGRSQLDSFFQYHETTLTWGLWLDL